MRTRNILCLFAAAAVTAAGCAGQVSNSGGLINEPAPTAASGLVPAVATEPASPIPPTQTLTAVPTNTNAPQQGYDSSSQDYGYGLDDYGSADAGATPTAGAGASTADQTTVGTTRSSLGLILVNGQGYTLYALTMDSPGVSTCSGSCLEAWPPFLATGAPIAGVGVQAALLGTISRSDGGAQVTYDGKPLYSYAQDTAAGDLNGQGKGGVWFAVTAEGDFAG